MSHRLPDLSEVAVGAPGVIVTKKVTVLGGDFVLPRILRQKFLDRPVRPEIEELLALSVLSLSDAERAEACATDPRARAIVERAEAFGPAEVERLGSRVRRSKPGQAAAHQLRERSPANAPRL